MYVEKISGIKGYLISINGDVINEETGKKIKAFITNSGYLQVSLTNKHKKFYIHRLVAKAFIDNKYNNKCVNHIDGNKLNNDISNLEWCSYSDNLKHSNRILGNKVWNIKLNKDEVSAIRLLLGKIKQNKIAKLFDVSPMVISRIKNNIQLEYKQ